MDAVFVAALLTLCSLGSIVGLGLLLAACIPVCAAGSTIHRWKKEKRRRENSSSADEFETVPLNENVESTGEQISGEGSSHDDENDKEDDDKEDETDKPGKWQEEFYMTTREKFWKEYDREVKWHRETREREARKKERKERKDRKEIAREMARELVRLERSGERPVQGESSRRGADEHEGPPTYISTVETDVKRSE